MLEHPHFFAAGAKTLPPAAPAVSLQFSSISNNSPQLAPSKMLAWILHIQSYLHRWGQSTQRTHGYYIFIKKSAPTGDDPQRPYRPNSPFCYRELGIRWSSSGYPCQVVFLSFKSPCTVYSYTSVPFSHPTLASLSGLAQAEGCPFRGGRPFERAVHT